MQSRHLTLVNRDKYILQNEQKETHKNKMPLQHNSSLHSLILHLSKRKGTKKICQSQSLWSFITTKMEPGESPEHGFRVRNFGHGFRVTVSGSLIWVTVTNHSFARYRVTVSGSTERSGPITMLSNFHVHTTTDQALVSPQISC